MTKINENSDISIDDLEIKNEEDTDDGKNDDVSLEEKKGFVLSENKLSLIKKLLKNIQESNEQVTQLLGGNISAEEEARIGAGQIGEILMPVGDSGQAPEGGRIVEGVFDGENMIGPDGKQYSVPANYASKSKLVEGDILKLTITATGTFVYKQIGPIERQRVVGMLEQDSSGNFQVVAGDKKWRVLTASVTYFKGGDRDEIIALIPKTGESKWAAVENIVKNIK